MTRPSRLFVSVVVLVGILVLTVIAVDLFWHDFFPRRFYVVEDGALYRGARQEDRVFRKIIRERGCKTVITLTGRVESHESIADEEGVRYLAYNWYGTGVGPFEQYREVARVLADPEARPVFFHCAGGQHRTNAATFAYLLENGTPPDEALETIRKYRFEPERDSGLAEHLRAYASWVED